MAGITDVAYVKKDSDKLKDALIEKVAIEGTRNVLFSLNENATIIFPSTHVVFEGLEERKENLDENESTSIFSIFNK